jgi:hypothetical protein
MPRKKSAPRKAPEKTPPPEPKRRGRRTKSAEPDPSGPPVTEHTPLSEPPAVEPEPAAVEPAGTEAGVPAAVTPDEAALVAKYGATHRIVPGSLRYAGGREGWGHERTVEIACAACPAVRVIATSDLHFPTTKVCATCAAAAKRNRRAKKRMK